MLLQFKDGLLSITHFQVDPQDIEVLVYGVGRFIFENVAPKTLRLIGEITPHETQLELTQYLQIKVFNTSAEPKSIVYKPENAGSEHPLKIPPRGVLIAQISKKKTVPK